MCASLPRAACLAWFALACTAAIASAQWHTDPMLNTAVSRDAGWEQFPRAVADGDGGLLVVWQVQTGTSFGYDLRAARLDALGFPLWTVDVVTESGDQRDHQAVSDGAGGMIVAWNDERFGQLNSDIYAQRIRADGSVAWTTDGVAVCEENSIQAYPRLVADGEGGAVIAWRDSRHYTPLGANIHAQRLNAAGLAQWTAGGVPVCQAFGNQLDPGITSDGAGGFLVAWQDERAGSSNCDVWAQKLSGAGVAQWAADGVGATTPANQRWYNNIDPVLPDGAGGAYVLLEDDHYTSADIDLYVVRFAADGSLPWGSAGLPVCTAVGIQRLGQPIAGSAGVVIVPWTDYRYGTADPDVYAQRFDASGAMSWPANGLAIAGSTAEEGFPLVVRQRGSAVMFAWADMRGGDWDLFAQPYDASGAALWPWPADVTRAGGSQIDPVGVLSGNCSVVLAWRDERWVGAAPPDDTSLDIYAQRVYCDGALAQRQIVVDVPNGGEAWQAGTFHRVEYHGVEVEGHDVALDYSTDLGASWSSVAYVSNSGARHVRDWRVPNTPSTQSLLRARVVDDPAVEDASDGPFTILFDPTSVDGATPPAHVALRAPSPNPGRATLSLVFGLPVAAEASLRVHDVSGRLVRTLHAGPATAGWHDVTWRRETDSGGRTGPGVYWLVLRSEGRTVTRRVVLTD